MAGIPHKMKIPYYSNYYASPRGKIWSIQRSGTPGHWLKPSLNKDGHHRVTLCNAAGPKTFTVERVVMNALNLVCHSKPMPGKEIVHRNGDKTDNSIENLYWR